MTDLQIRRPSFGIDDTVPFQWQPENPTFGIFGNAFTFIAIAFERYIVAVVRQALPRIKDEEVRAEADAFLKQEAQHARAHYHHAQVLVGRYPGLAEMQSAVDGAYDALLYEESLKFNLAYIADLEATFTPLFKMVFDHRGPLFDGGDERVGTMLLWHFAEEIEHRSSALIVQRHLTKDPWYRLRVARKVFGHVKGVYETIIAGFEEHVPLEDSHVPSSVAIRSGIWTAELASRFPVLQRRWGSATQPMLGHVPGSALLTMAWHSARSQAPGHDPADEPLPAWASTWHAAYDAGDDIATYAGVRLGSSSTAGGADDSAGGEGVTAAPR